MAAVEERLVRDADRLILLFDPPFDRGAAGARLHQGIRARASARTAASTRMPRPGWCWRPRCWGRANGRWSCSTCSTRSITRRLPRRVARYKVEPYVVAADVYGAPPHTGRGGWTWYTGSAGWLYRVGLEAILGFRLRGSRLQVEPCVPPGWPGYSLTYRHGQSTYHLVVENAAGTGRGVRSVRIDGAARAGDVIDLLDDGRHHEVESRWAEEAPHPGVGSGGIQLLGRAALAGATKRPRRSRDPNSRREEITMATLSVLKFGSPDGAEKGLDPSSKTCTRRNLIVLEDAAAVTWPVGSRKPRTGHLQQVAGTDEGALGGMFWGLLLGTLFFVPFLGVAVGTVSGALVGHFATYGISGTSLMRSAAR